MELIDLSPIKPMLMRSLENPKAIQVFMNYHLWLLWSFELLLLWIFIIWSLLYIAYLLWKSKVWKNKSKKERKKIIKKTFLEYWHKVKKPLRKLRYLIIWGILISFSWLLVSLIFYFYTKGWDVYNCSFSPEENMVLGYWSFLSLIIFLIAPAFIMFCFGNKFIRNIWILIYIFWIWFISMWRFISIGCVWMKQEEEDETEVIESIENFGTMNEIENMEEMDEMEEISGLRTGSWKKYGYVLLPDSVEISVKDKVIEWEAVDLSVTIIKGWKIMNNYEGTIFLSIVDENWDFRKSSEYILPNGWRYTFKKEDLWYKKFQRWLEIKKEWTFYIEVEDLLDDNEAILWRQKIEVVKKS